MTAQIHAVLHYEGDSDPSNFLINGPSVSDVAFGFADQLAERREEGEIDVVNLSGLSLTVWEGGEVVTFEVLDKIRQRIYSKISDVLEKRIKSDWSTGHRHVHVSFLSDVVHMIDHYEWEKS